MSSYETEASFHVLRRCQDKGNGGDNKISIVRGEVLTNVWVKIAKRLSENMVDSMLDRVQAELDSKG